MRHAGAEIWCWWVGINLWVCANVVAMLTVYNFSHDEVSMHTQWSTKHTLYRGEECHCIIPVHVSISNVYACICICRAWDDLKDTFLVLLQNLLEKWLAILNSFIVHTARRIRAFDCVREFVCCAASLVKKLCESKKQTICSNMTREFNFYITCTTTRLHLQVINKQTPKNFLAFK